LVFILVSRDNFAAREDEADSIEQFLLFDS
jgi:hypothetical protein